MQQINPSLAHEHLEFALDDHFIHIRWYAANALAPEMDSSALDTLARLLHDDGKPSWEEDSIRDIAAKALQRIDTPESRGHPRRGASAGEPDPGMRIFVSYARVDKPYCIRVIENAACPRGLVRSTSLCRPRLVEGNPAAARLVRSFHLSPVA